MDTDVILNQENDRKQLEEMLKDPENRKKAAEIALQIRSAFPSWFEPKKLTKKFKISYEGVLIQLESLMLFKMCVAKRHNNKTVFKIDIDKRTQREFLSRQIEKREKELKLLREELANLD